MVCAKCQKKSSTTSLATPEVKKKSDMYLGSPAGSSSSKAGTKTSATLGNNGIGKSKLLSKAARILMLHTRQLAPVKNAALRLTREENIV
ncbi:hypothetical protein EAE96_010695 [Botrytis aclada]|nr:hypothetical protein EAE96_010695 [Botrytis aclada]